MSIVQFDGTDGIEILINTDTGESFASVRGYARMSGKHPSTISRRLKGVASEGGESLEVETQGGFQGVALVTESLICKWIPKDNPDVAEKLLQLGVRLYMHAIAGYKLPTGSVVPIKPYPVEALPPADVRVAQMTSALQALGVDLDNPRYKQGLQDYALNLILGQKLLPSSVEEPQWLGVVEIAIDMGYSSSMVTRNRSQLGKAIAQKGFKFRKEKRLCNGTQKPINLYQDCQELRDAIAEYMNQKMAA